MIKQTVCPQCNGTRIGNTATVTYQTSCDYCGGMGYVNTHIVDRRDNGSALVISEKLLEASK